MARQLQIAKHHICFRQDFKMMYADKIAKYELRVRSQHIACADPEGGGGQESGPPLKNHKNVGFISNTGPDPLEITKLPSQHSMLGHRRHASEPPFKFGSPLPSSTKKLESL